MRLRHRIAPEFLKNLYTYSAVVTDVYDADTITVDIDLGLQIIVRNQKIRLFGINAPEVRGSEREEGIISRDWLRGMILNKKVRLVTYKDKKGKYGRYIADVFLNNINLNDQLVELGLAEYRTY